jgi:hypothetical protein
METGVAIYDNQPGTDDGAELGAGTLLGGGGVVIQTQKAK